MPPLPDSDSYSSLGGELNEARAVVDPTTDLPKDADCATRANAAAMTRLIHRGYAVFTRSGTTFTLVEYDAVWGNTNGTYAPVASYSSAGVIGILLPATVPDARNAGGTCNVNARRGHAWLEYGAVAIARIDCLRIAANQLVVRTWDAANNPTDMATSDVLVVEWR